VDKKADVFYIYPTAYSREASSDPNVCTVDNAGMMKSAHGAYARQAMAFNPSANIYAPYYRQIDATYQLGLSAAQQKANIAREPLKEILAANRRAEENVAVSETSQGATERVRTFAATPVSAARGRVRLRTLSNLRWMAVRRRLS